MPLAFRRFCLLALLVVLAGLLPVAHPVQAQTTITVSNLNDSGPGSLRTAITQANAASGSATITFSVTGAIVVESPLPTLTGGNITINAVGAGNQPTIELRGSGVVEGQGLLIKSSNNTVRGLIINGFRTNILSEDIGGAGIIISGFGGAPANNNIIEFCYIGTNTLGTASGHTLQSNNQQGGILIIAGASNNIVRNNVLSGNFGPGVLLRTNAFGQGESQTGNVITNNLIGLNAGGTAALGNRSQGVFFSNRSVDNTVGPGNTISGNGASGLQTQQHGVQVGGNATNAPGIRENKVFGNRIGTNQAGTVAIPNAEGGVLVRGAVNTVVGGAGANRNIISGNTRVGVEIAEPNDTPPGETRTVNTIVENNFIGLNAAGTQALPNTQAGVLLVNRASGAIVRNNVIGGNTFDGVRIEGAESATDAQQNPRNNTITNNSIGVNPTGNGAIANGRHGVFLMGNANANIISGNRITGNGASGITLDKGDSQNAPTGNTISGNQVGNFPNNNTLVGNTNDGIRLLGGSRSNTVGPDNVVRGHSRAGVAAILIQGSGTTQNTVRGNTLSNNTIGIKITDAATANTLGGSGAGNTIQNNTQYGISITGNGVNNNTVANNNVTGSGADGIRVEAGAINNRITATTTNNNTGLGIALVTGGNRQGQAGRPALANLSVSGATLNGTANNCVGGCTLQIFTSSTAVTDEGPVFLRSVPNVSGEFSASVAGCQNYLIFTLTDADGNTSQFINNLGPIPNCAAAAPAVTLTNANPAERTIAAGTSTTYEHTLTNSGTAPGTFEVSYTSTQTAWVTVDPANGTRFDLEPGESRQIRVTVVVPANVDAALFDQTVVRARVVGNAASERTATDITRVQRTVGVTLDPDRTGNVVTLPATVTYEHTLTNTGNARDTFTLAGSVVTEGVTGVTFAFTPATPIALNPGQSQTVQVRVSIPAGVTAPVVTTRVTATSQADSSVSDSATQTTPIERAPVPLLTPARLAESGRPGETITYRHTLRNAGTEAGVFRLAVELEDWNFTITPNANTDIPLNPGQETEVTLVVSIPANAVAATQRAATITASVVGNTSVSTAVDTTTVLLVPALSFVPNREQEAGPGQQIVYQHTLTNNGNGVDTFTVTANTPNGWSASIEPVGQIRLAAGATQAVTLTLTVPQGTEPGEYPATVTARSTTDTTVSATVTDLTTVVAAPVPLLSEPQTKATDPGVAVSFTHPLRNVGNEDGTFALTVLGLPDGWTATFEPGASVAVAQGATVNVTVTVTPPAGTEARDYPFRLRATAQSGPGASSEVANIVRVNRQAALSFEADVTNTSPPNTVVTTTHTLVNNGNFTDQITLAARTSQGWEARVVPATVQLAPGAEQEVQIGLVIPPGLRPDVVNTTTVTATSSVPTVSESVTIETTIEAAPGVMWDQDLIVRGGDVGAPITFTFTLRNSGSIDQTYALEIANVPAGWTATIAPEQTERLEPNETATVQVVVQTPAGAARGDSADIVIRAISDQGTPPPSATATARATIGDAFGTLIEPDNRGESLPGRAIRYNHTVTNIGFNTDTIALDVISSLGWRVDVQPVNVLLEPGQSTTVTVTVQVPFFAAATGEDTTIVTARSTSDREAAAGQAENRTTVLQVAGVNFSSDEWAQPTPGARIVFEHSLINTGNGPDSYTFTVTQDANWQVTVTPQTTPRLSRSARYSVQVTVVVPQNVAADAVNRIRIRATSRFDSNVSAEVLDTISPFRPQNVTPPGTRSLYLPAVMLEGGR